MSVERWDEEAQKGQIRKLVENDGVVMSIGFVGATLASMEGFLNANFASSIETFDRFALAACFVILGSIPSAWDKFHKKQK